MRNRSWSGRGRPRGGHRSQFDTRILEYLVKLSTKRRIQVNEFFNAIVAAWKNGKAIHQGLTIKLRKKKNNRATFLITNSHKVVAQFSIPEYILEETDPFSGFSYVYDNTKHTSKLEEKANLLIKDLKPGMKKIKLGARVFEISKPKLVLTRFNDYALFSNITLSDKSGKIKMALWNERINSVSVNDEVQIENANVATFRGEKQLRIGRNGKLKVIENGSDHETKHTIKCITN